MKQICTTDLNRMSLQEITSTDYCGEIARSTAGTFLR
jgi:hypothetical protein